MWAKINTRLNNHSRSGFTIVELLIVIVIIGILAAITIIAYNGIQDRAKQSEVLSMANQAGKKIRLYYASEGAYPPDLVTAGVTATPGIAYDYTQSGNWFCVAARTTSGSIVAAGVSSDGNCSQLTATYFSNNSLTGSPTLTRTDPNIDFSWGSGSPGSGIPADNFSARWTGYITAPTTDTYTLYLWDDDKLRLYLDNTLVSDQWTSGCCTWRNLTYSFTAGQKVPISVEMAELGGSAGARLQWSYTNQAQTAIPSSAFSSS